jgi:polyphosphate kinase
VAIPFSTMVNRRATTTPVLDENLKKEIQHYLDIQLQLNTKARVVDKSLKNEYLRPAKGKQAVDTQLEVYEYFNV